MAERSVLQTRPPATSWWLGLTREQFSQVAQQEFHSRMAHGEPPKPYGRTEATAIERAQRIKREGGEL